MLVVWVYKITGINIINKWLLPRGGLCGMEDDLTKKIDEAEGIVEKHRKKPFTQQETKQIRKLTDDCIALVYKVKAGGTDAVLFGSYGTEIVAKIGVASYAAKIGDWDSAYSLLSKVENHVNHMTRTSRGEDARDTTEEDIKRFCHTAGHKCRTYAKEVGYNNKMRQKFEELAGKFEAYESPKKK